ncbi:MAG: PIG-L family deacetylase [Candidatus Wildermuthbacteria bacterium]|nr:PIG-L family deacetylase [Candidatus Wildermuthbacteria bacterium]
MKILAIGAHPDDVEFGCAPILIKEAEKGNKVKIFCLSLGEAGSAGTPKERKQEAMEASKVIGAEIAFLDMGGDCHIEYTPVNSIKLAKIIREEKPNIILAPDTNENQHPDHSAAGKLTRDASRLARYGGLEELKSLAVHKIDQLYYYPITQFFGAKPNILIDVSQVHKKWTEAMECHKSQMKSKKYSEMISSWSRALGSAIGVEYAVGLKTNEPIRLDNVSDINLSSRNY